MFGIKKNSVVQANEKAGDWCGCLLLVDEVKAFGVMAHVKIPFSGDAYVRLKFDQIDYIGEAVLITEEGENYD